jgi:hypothetical protein
MWSISASGPKDNVLNKIQNATPPIDAGEVRAFRDAQAECRKQVEAIAEDAVGVAVLASGGVKADTIVVSPLDPPDPPDDGDEEEDEDVADDEEG